MIILVKTSTITFSLDVQKEDRIEVLYNKVAERSGQKIFQFSLLYAGDILSNSTSKGTVGACNIKNESTIHMVVIKEFKLSIQYNDKSYQVQIPNNEGLKISHLKIQVKNLLQEVIDGLETKTNRAIVLSKNGIELDESSPLQSVLNNGDEVEMRLIEVAEPTKNITTTTTTSSSSTHEATLEKKKREEKSIQEENDRLLQSFIDNNDSMSSDVEIMFCFDTTGSMSSIIQNVKREVSNTVKRLIQDIPNIKIGIMGLGDYCDGAKLITTLDLTSKESDLITFIKEIPPTIGGDCPEAYEYALYKAKDLSWSSHTSKAFVLIGDDIPHEPSLTNLKINWFKECDDLHNMGIKIYGIKANSSRNAVFYDEIAERTGGISIDFKNFDLITRLFLAICYRESSKTQFEKYQSEIKNDKDNSLSKILDDLNQDNYKVINSDDVNGNEDINNNNNVKTNIKSDNDGSSSITKTQGNKKVIVKKYGVPINMKSMEPWFNHERDTAKTPTYVYKQNLGYFVKYEEIKSSNCNLM
ncbi:hypothetical protein RB653_005649 [Dictyostelium firmibasis]|uniref:Ubiquitin-like domain-containing protein n=1 Tax=Dictyostelium firmibasis TaxID=79012 RepID=A0AAN7U8B8_9MYCE